VVVLDVEKDNLELEDPKRELSNTSRKLVSVTQKFERAEMSYQETTRKMAVSLTELKG
jgi:hypothetical protein